jgi:hypothetical protein
MEKTMIDLENIIEMVKRECKGETTPEENAWFQNPDNHYAWCKALSQAITEFELQLTYHKDKVTLMASDAKLGIISAQEYMFEKEKFDQWQRKGLRYRAGIHGRLTEVKALLAENPKMDAVEEVMRLTKAIQEHKQALQENGDPDTFDYMLWASIDSTA